MKNEEKKIIHPILGAIVEINNGHVASVKGGLGQQVANALQQVYKKEIDPSSGYVLESMQIDESTNAAIYSSVVDEKDHYVDSNKYYTVVYAVDPVTISPVDLIDFKASANEMVNDDGRDADMVVYLDKPHTQAELMPVMESIKNVASVNKIKIIYGVEALVDHLNGVKYA
jgi:hypothetical protein